MTNFLFGIILATETIINVFDWLAPDTPGIIIPSAATASKAFLDSSSNLVKTCGAHPLSEDVAKRKQNRGEMNVVRREMMR